MTTINNPAAEAPTVAILSNDGTELLAILQDGTVRGTIEDAGPAAQQFVAALRGLTEAIAAQAKAEALREAADDLNPQLREYRLGAHKVLTQRINPAGGDDTRSLQLALVAAKHTESWLRARAATIKAAE